MDPQSPPVRQWRVPREVPVLKAVGALALVALGLVFAGGDPVRPALAGLAAAGLLAWALRDVVAPVRLAVDPDGLTVLRGFAGRRRLPWDAVEAIRLDRRSRRGITAETLEIDAGESLHLFGRRDLDAPLDEVAAALDEARPAR
ncbi:PH domain-containing protein [Micromonospora aurantiaca]|uniref:PH domain-containing protein n=1 Tax=Micromonospora TaxID=1873 RepID=UPI0004C0069D|nr:MULTISPECIES: PH domain-containing protein [Micromonospora]MDG4754850.1 PH domain-containing protein [Micromonospora sp. WMMD718]MDW3850849.1 PH domain-containing protein [Micromonospora sp. BRA006-A]SCL39979.1 PH domain-containing protein [Micromonospora aurantiaca]